MKKIALAYVIVIVGFLYWRLLHLTICSSLQAHQVEVVAIVLLIFCASSVMGWLCSKRN